MARSRADLLQHNGCLYDGLKVQKRLRLALTANVCMPAPGTSCCLNRPKTTQETNQPMLFTASSASMFNAGLGLRSPVQLDN